MRSVKDLQENHVEFSLSCFDRLYFNLYVPILQSLGGIVHVIRNVLEFDIPFPSAFKAIRDGFVGEVDEFAANLGLEIYKFNKDEENSKEEIARRHLKNYPLKEGVFFIGKAQEKVKTPQGSWVPSKFHPSRQWFKLRWGHVMANQFYFYFVDEDWGMGFIKFSSYAPFSGRFYINGHEYVKRQLEKKGVAFEALDNGIGKCEDPEAAQKIANGITAKKTESLIRKWLSIVPNPQKELALYGGRKFLKMLKYNISVLQAEVALTQVWKRAQDGLQFFEQVIRENIDLGRPEKVGVIFGKRITKKTLKENRFMSRVFTHGVIPVFNVFYKSNKLKQYYKEAKALRNEMTINNPRDFGIGKTLNTENFAALRQVGLSTIQRLLNIEVLSHDPSVSLGKIGAIESAAEVAGRRISPLPRSNKRVRALFTAIITCHLICGGFRHRDLKGRVAHLQGKDPNEITTGQMTYDLRRLRGHGIIRKVAGTHRYEVTEEGLRLVLFISRVERRVYREGMSDMLSDISEELRDPAIPPRIRNALDTFTREVDKMMASKLALPS